jgi:hypothetical protein
LKLCGSFEGQTILPLRSYLRIDDIEEVPLGILIEEFRSDGLSLMLQEKSFDTVQHCLRIVKGPSASFLET